MVRRRLTSHAGFYAPVTALICPCKGNEPRPRRQSHRAHSLRICQLRNLFFAGHESGPCAEIIERVKAASQQPVHIVIAGPPEDCSEKVFNLRRAVEALPENFEVLVFTDSDVRLPRGWLTKLVAPLQDARIGATTAYRWMIPSGAIGAGGFASALASAWNASIATLLGSTAKISAGAAAPPFGARLSTMCRCSKRGGRPERRLRDDARARRRRHADRLLPRMPRCHAASLDRHSLLEFTNRQILITRVYSPRRWAMGALAHLSYSLTLIL